jgi:hypothetical protein
MISRTCRTLVAVLTVAACTTLLAASAVAAGSVDGVWVDGAAHDLVVTGPASATAHATPLYVIAPISAAHPLHPLADAKTHGFGAHDHVIGLSHPNSTFHGACDLTLVVPGPRAVIGKTVMTRRTLTPAAAKPLLYRARLGGKLVPLDTATRIKQAAHAGLATLVDTHNPLACTVSPRKSG